MAFKQKQNIVGATSQKLGEAISIDGKYLASSGVNNDEVNIYERDSLGEWSFLSTKSALDLAPSLDINKGNIFMPVTTFPLVHFYSETDNFTTQRYIYDSSFPAITGFGASVSADGNYVVVGSPEFDTNKGKVYIFYKGEDENWGDDTIWTDFVTIQPNDADTNQFFGTSVVINDDFLIVGAKGDNQSRGAVYVFKKNEETGIFEQSQKIIASDGVAGDEFGGQVSISDNYFAVGAEKVDTSDTEINTGAVYIFSHSNVWNQLRKITSVDESGLIANQFGHSVDLKGDYLIVGSPNAGNKGVVDVFYKKRNWGHLKKITSDQEQGDLFGDSVGIDYPNLVVGASGYETVSSDERGRIYIFEDPEVRLRLAQEFDADFQPSKASVYLKRSGKNTSSSWLLTDSSPSIIDASNFSTITSPTGGVSLSPISQWKSNDNEASPIVVDSQGLQDGGSFQWIGGLTPLSVSLINTSLLSELHTSPLTNMDRYLRLPSQDTSQNGTAIIVAANSAYSFTDDFNDEPFSVSCWANFNDLTTGGTMVAKVDANLTIKREWQFSHTENGKIRVALYSQGSSSDRIGFITDEVEVVTGQWYHLTFSYSAVAQDITDFKLYIDGSEVTIVAYVDGVYTSMKDTGASLGIGGIILQLGSPLFWQGIQAVVNASMDNVCIFDKVISQDDVSFLYQEGSGTEDLSGNPNQLVFNDEITGFTGNGYIINKEDNPPTDSNGVVNYPIRNSVPNNYNVWMRCRKGNGDISGSSDFIADLLLDGIVVKEIDEVITDGEWSWVSTSLVLPDTQQHILGIRMKEKDSAIDKIYIDADTDFIPEGDGPPYIDSPYVTIHMKVYESDGSIPTNLSLAYDYKTTLDEVIQDDWYNFDISFADKIVDEYGESLFLVMSSSGANADNFIIWEVISSDEYSSWNAGLRLTEVALTSNIVNTSLTKRLYYQAKAGDADIDVDTWYLDSTQTHAFKIFSDFDPIEDV